MSYANGTTHYNLPQTLGTDKRDWFDTNKAFADVDAALYAAATGQAADAEAIVEINQKLVTDEENIASLQTLTSTHTSQISTLQTTVNAQASQIADTRQDAEDMITAFNEGAAETSSHAYAIGDYFIYNDVLYKATAAIAIGDTIVPNTNCSATNVTTEISTLNSDIDNVFNAEYIHGDRLSVDANQSIQSYTKKYTGVFNLDGTDYGDSNTTVDVLILRSNFVDGAYNSGLILGLITSSNNGTLYDKRGKAMIQTEFQNNFTGWKSLT